MFITWHLKVLNCKIEMWRWFIWNNVWQFVWRYKWVELMINLFRFELKWTVYLMFVNSVKLDYAYTAYIGIGWRYMEMLTRKRKKKGFPVGEQPITWGGINKTRLHRGVSPTHSSSPTTGSPGNCSVIVTL